MADYPGVMFKNRQDGKANLKVIKGRLPEPSPTEYVLAETILKWLHPLVHDNS